MRKTIDFIRKSASSFCEGSTLKRNFLIVARGNIIALALPVLAAPFLTRIFDPSAFALLGVFLAAIGIISAFSTARLDWATPNARTDLIAASLFVLGAIVLAAVTIISVFCLAALAAFPEISPQTHALGWMIWLAPLVLAATGIRALLNGWLVRTGELRAVAHSVVVQASVNVATSFITGLTGMVTVGLVVASALASFAGISTLAAKAGTRLRNALQRVKVQTVAVALRKHGKQACWSTCVSVLNAFTTSGPILLLGILYSPKEVGWYVFMQRMVAGPLGALSAALGQSFWSHAAKLARDRNMAELKRIYQSVTLWLALASVPVVAICIAAPLFVGALLGEAEWSGAGYVLAALTPLLVANLLFSPTNHLVVLRKQHLQLLVDALRIGLMTAGVAVAYFLELGFVMAVLLSSFGALFGYATIYIIQRKIHTL
jgi:O-antigen/teichoic acid export membrane protein